MQNATKMNRLQRLEHLVEVCRSLGKSEDLDALLQAVVSEACDLTNSQYSYIMVYEHETEFLKIVAGPQAYRDSLKRIRIPLEKSLAGWVYTKSKPAVIHNAQNDIRIFREIERSLGYITHSILAVPLIFRGQTIGVLEVVNKPEEVHYTEDDLTILDTLASQAAVATLSTLLIEETERANEEVHELERLKTDFIAIASHELRTPLGLILGHGTFLRELIADERQKSQVEIIIRNAERLKTIIEDLSNVNSFQTGSARIRHKLISINSLVNKIASAQKDTAARKKVSIVTQLPEFEPKVDGDEDKLGIAINNLLSNAISFSNPNGHVWVSVEALPGYTQITVADEGIGIPNKDLQKIFERFYQVQSHLTRKHGGMGLGLSVAKAMVELHRGQIWAESEEGKGSKFHILLPLSSEQAKTLEPVFQS